MVIDPERDEAIIEAFAKRLAEAASVSYLEDPRMWKTVATVALNECGSFSEQSEP